MYNIDNAFNNNNHLFIERTYPLCSRRCTVKYNKNLGYYYLKQRFENYYFDKKKLKEMDKEFFDVTIDEEEKNNEQDDNIDIHLAEVSLSPYHIQDYEDCGEDRVEKIPLYGPIAELLEKFVEFHFHFYDF